MPGEFAVQGSKLLDRGYLIVPIVPGAKRPSISNWETSRLGPQDLTRFANAGVGVLCGQGRYPLVGLDVDSDNAELVQKFTSWCRQTFGPTCERVGRAPKSMLVYQAAGSWAKRASVPYANGSATFRHRLELLGRGQQFVAYAIHPDTQKPYQWIDPFGGLASVEASRLPIITEEQAQQAIAAFEALAQAAGMAPAARASPATLAGDNTLGILGSEQPLGLDLATLRNLLDFIPDNYDYDAWLKVGLALHVETGGSDEGLTLWDAWSHSASNYASFEDLSARWAGFARETRRITGAWLQARAKETKTVLARTEREADLTSALDKINKCRHADELLNEVASYAGAVSRRDMSNQVRLEAALKDRFEALAGVKISIGNVRTAMRATTPSEAPATLPVTTGKAPASYPFSQAGNADRMVDRYGRNLMHALGLGWFRWTGNGGWVKADIVEVHHLAYEVVRSLDAEFATIQNAEARKAAEKFALASQTAPMVEAMVKLVAITKGMTCAADSLDRNKSLLGCKNGIVDLDTGLLLPADRAHRITMNTNCDYDPAADQTLWRQTVLDVFSGRQHLVTFLQRLMGYALLGRPDEDVLAIPYGMGCNGKSTIFNVLRSAFGDYGRMAGASTFVQAGNAGTGGQGAAPREDILRLRNARLVYVTEPNENSILREDIVKSMTGGEPIPARGMYERTSIEVAPTWLCLMPTNHKPLIVGDDYGIWRRLLPIPFTVNFDDTLLYKKDPGREDRLRENLPAVLAWCVQGALDYQLYGFQRPSEVVEAATEYRTDMDLLSEWSSECCDFGPSRSATLMQLWVAWKLWAEPRGELKLISNTRLLDRRLRSRWNYDPRKREFTGISVKESASFGL